MVIFYLLLVALVAIANANVNFSEAAVFADIEQPTCKADLDCEFSCCTYNDNKTIGKCSEISEVPHCANRKTNYHITLYCIIAALFTVGATCCWLKKKENTARRMAL